MSTWSVPSEFTVGLLATTDWGASGSRRRGHGAADLSQGIHSQQDLTRALVSICGLGQFELRVNGSNVSDAVMEPSWTNYTKNCHYVTTT